MTSPERPLSEFDRAPVPGGEGSGLTRQENFQQSLLPEDPLYESHQPSPDHLVSPESEGTPPVPAEPEMYRPSSTIDNDYKLGEIDQELSPSPRLRESQTDLPKSLPNPDPLDEIIAQHKALRHTSSAFGPFPLSLFKKKNKDRNSSST